MKEIFEMYARYNQAGNKAVYGMLSRMANDDREKDRGSHYGSLSGLFRHILGGTKFFLCLYKGVLDGAAQKALEGVEGLALPEGSLRDVQWKDLEKVLEAADGAYVRMAEALTDADMTRQIKVEWYGGNPPAVPLSFMLHQLVVHNTHHRGQVSQILDSLKIDNDYSGIDAAFLPR